MGTEYGIFTDEGCIEAGCWSREEAEMRLVSSYPEEIATIHAICCDHPEQPADACSRCNADDPEDAIEDQDEV